MHSLTHSFVIRTTYREMRLSFVCQISFIRYERKGKERKGKEGRLNYLSSNYLDSKFEERLAWGLHLQTE